MAEDKLGRDHIVLAVLQSVLGADRDAAVGVVASISTG